MKRILSMRLRKHCLPQQNDGWMSSMCLTSGNCLDDSFNKWCLEPTSKLISKYKIKIVDNKNQKSSCANTSNECVQAIGFCCVMFVWYVLIHSYVQKRCILPYSNGTHSNIVSLKKSTYNRRVWATFKGERPIEFVSAHKQSTSPNRYCIEGTFVFAVCHYCFLFSLLPLDTVIHVHSTAYDVLRYHVDG